MSDEEMAAISQWRNSPLFDERDRAVLAYADAVGLENSVSDETYGTLGEHFSEQQIMKICIAASFAGLVNRVHATFRTDVDEATLASVADAPFCLIHTP